MLLFSHGIFVDSSLWGRAGRAPGSGWVSLRATGDSDGCPPDSAQPRDASPRPRGWDLLADFVDALDLGPVTVVGDSGGAVSQMFAAQHPGSWRRWCFTNCDALEVYPAVSFTLLLRRSPGCRRNRPLRPADEAQAGPLGHLPDADRRSDPGSPAEGVAGPDRKQSRNPPWVIGG